MQGTTTVAFYNKVRTFTANDFYSGEVKKWMEQTYAWWYALSPCSTAQTTQTTTTTTTNTTSNTSSSSSSSSSSDSSGSGGSSDNSGDSGGSSDNSGDNDGGGSDDSGDNGSGDDGGSDESDNNNEEKEQEETEETEEEQEQEEEQEEESEEEEEESEEESEEEESEEENKRNPILISANLMAMSGLDGTLSNVASFGFSQTALNGVDSYSANMMIWDNLKQFTLGGAKSHIFYNYDNAEDIIIRDGDNTYVLGQVYGRGTIHTIQSVSVSFMYMYGVMNITTGLSNVYIVQKNEKWKGCVDVIFGIHTKIFDGEVTPPGEFFSHFRNLLNKAPTQQRLCFNII